MHSFSSEVTYLARRIKRLFPASATCLLLTFLALHYLAPLRLSRLVYEDLVAASLHYANVHLSAQSYFKTTTPSFVLHYWSLSRMREMLFCYL
jgi:peptidoglycan/LPS O-acetylase OafA/YrhL